MESTLSTKDILGHIEKLNFNNKIDLLARLANIIKREQKGSTPVPLIKLQGLGRELWNKTDTDSYLKTERESWG
jgi:F420-0:gamma-glutamyl ligase